MSAPKSQYDQDLDNMELTQLRRGYNFAIEDLNKVLTDSVSEATVTEELSLLLKIQARVNEMERVRFPQSDQQN